MFASCLCSKHGKSSNIVKHSGQINLLCHWYTMMDLLGCYGHNSVLVRHDTCIFVIMSVLVFECDNTIDQITTHSFKVVDWEK